VRALSLASRAFFDAPPAGFSEHPVLTPRGAMMVAAPGQEALLEEHWTVMSAVAKTSRRLTAAQVLELVPAFRPEQVAGGLLEEDASDMDVHAIHQGYLRGLRHAGGSVVCDAPVTALRRVGDLWHVEAGGATYEAPVVINAAGAWADELAKLAGVPAIGLQPRRRSAMIFAPPPGMKIESWPMAIGVTEDWYFKPDAGMVLGSPANADDVPPQDVQPEELDIALAIDRIEAATTLAVRPRRTWAGLRSFVADGDLVGGFAADAPGFFWLAAQGGYGIQTAAAMGEAGAALVRGEALPARIAAFGLDAEALGQARASLRAAR
jgi:D-arginine dehydrogenase